MGVWLRYHDHMATWKEGLSSFGQYYAGIVDEENLDKVLELHKRDTVSTFGTRSSRRVTADQVLVR